MTKQVYTEAMGLLMRFDNDRDLAEYLCRKGAEDDAHAEYWIEVSAACVDMLAAGEN